MSELLVISDVEINDTYVFLRVNNKGYKYSFGDTKKVNEALYKSYWITFGRNKGRFLNKIKPFLIKDA